jgi:hypothetical protein
MLADVLSWRSRLITVVAALIVVSGHITECRGWLTTPEDRMACCQDESQCPMHKGGDRPGTRTVSQADADQCCAAGSQSDHSLPSTTQAAPADSVASVPVAVTTGLTLAPRWTANVIGADTGPPTERARHVLLSVFLI